ncbi:patatin family protein [Catenulispora yoronensis]
MSGTEADPTVRHRLYTVLAERTASGSLPGARADGHRVALAIEGGGMRGTVSAGMALAVHELGLLPAFDAVYGASAGAISSTWLLSSRPEGLRGWTDPAFAKALIRRRNVLRGRPLVDVRQLVEVVYRQVFPLDFASVLANPIELHPLATDVLTGEATDLHAELVDEATLRLAMRASAALPLLAGGPVTVGGRRYFDAGVAESIPFRQALRDGATHVLVLRSRRRSDSDSNRDNNNSNNSNSSNDNRDSDGATNHHVPSRGTRLVANLGLRPHTPSCAPPSWPETPASPRTTAS